MISSSSFKDLKNPLITETDDFNHIDKIAFDIGDRDSSLQKNGKNFDKLEIIKSSNNNSIISKYQYILLAIISDLVTLSLILIIYSALEPNSLFGKYFSVGYEIVLCMIIRSIGMFCAYFFKPHHSPIQISYQFLKTISTEIIVLSFIYTLVRLCILGSQSINSNNNDNSIINVVLFFLSTIFAVLETSAIYNYIGVETVTSHGNYQSFNNEDYVEINLNSDVSDGYKSRSNHKKNKVLGGFNTIRLFSSIHIIIFHFYENDDASFIWINFVSWGGSALTLFFLLSGFVLSYSYIETICQAEPLIIDEKKDEVKSNFVSSSSGSIGIVDFWFKRFFRLYPSYVASIIIIIPLVGVENAWDTSALITIFFCVQTWSDDYFDNQYNTPAWTVGSFLFLYLIFPACARFVGRNVSATEKNQLQMCGLYWALTLFATLIQMGYSMGQPFYPLYKLVFKAHFQEFLFGVSLGYFYLLSLKGDKNIYVDMISKYGLSVGLVMLLLIFLFADIHNNLFFLTASSNGLLLPLFAVIVLGNAYDRDMLVKPILNSRILEFIGQFSYQIYIFQTVANEISIKLDATPYFLVILLFMSVLCYYLVEIPFSKILLYLYNKIGDHGKCITSTFNNIILMIYDSPYTCFAMIKYYFAMALIIVGYILVVGFAIEAQNQLLVVDSNDPGGLFVVYMRWTILIGLPAISLAILGQLIWCPWNRVKIPTMVALIENYQAKMYFRIVTRGKHPILVKDNVSKAIAVLDSCLPRSKFHLEVVTDNVVDSLEYLFENFYQSIPPEERKVMLNSIFTEIVVPTSFECPSGAKFKARALHYAILNSVATESDWIVHLDEETKFTSETVQYCLAHCLSESQSVKAGVKSYGNIGQGVIVYGTGTSIENYITTLADSIRVGDDFGKFRIQYETHYPWIGMHGSFVVCPNSVEKLIGFDHGMKGSITEDAYFSLVAWSKGVKFTWIDGYMYEQSPFSIYDFIMQRRRWFGGLWFVCRETELIPFRYRFCLLFMVVTWAFSSLPIIVTFTSMFIGVTDVSSSNKYNIWLVGFLSSIVCWSYILGFAKTFSIRDGLIRYFILLFLQCILQPIYALMEIIGVLSAIIAPPTHSFHIVKKESMDNLAKFGSTENLRNKVGNNDGSPLANNDSDSSLGSGIKI